MTDEHECERCGAWMRDGECAANCETVKVTLAEAHDLLDRVLTNWMYGKTDPTLQRDLELWCRVAGAPGRQVGRQPVGQQSCDSTLLGQADPPPSQRKCTCEGSFTQSVHESNAEGHQIGCPRWGMTYKEFARQYDGQADNTGGQTPADEGSE